LTSCYILSNIHTLPILFQYKSHSISIIHQPKKQILYFLLIFYYYTYFRLSYTIKVVIWNFIRLLLSYLRTLAIIYCLIINLDLYYTCLNSSELLSSENYDYVIYKLGIMLSVEAKINYLHSTNSSPLYLLHH